MEQVGQISLPDTIRGLDITSFCVNSKGVPILLDNKRHIHYDGKVIVPSWGTPNKLCIDSNDNVYATTKNHNYYIHYNSRFEQKLQFDPRLTNTKLYLVTSKHGLYYFDKQLKYVEYTPFNKDYYCLTSPQTVVTNTNIGDTFKYCDNVDIVKIVKSEDKFYVLCRVDFDHNTVNFMLVLTDTTFSILNKYVLDYPLVIKTKTLIYNDKVILLSSNNVYKMYDGVTGILIDTTINTSIKTSIKTSVKTPTKTSVEVVNDIIPFRTGPMTFSQGDIYVIDTIPPSRLPYNNTNSTPEHTYIKIYSDRKIRISMLFCLMLLVQDNELHCCVDANDKVKRFFNITNQLPVELKMKLCHVCFNSPKEYICNKDWITRLNSCS